MDGQKNTQEGLIKAKVTDGLSRTTQPQVKEIHDLIHSKTHLRYGICTVSLSVTSGRHRQEPRDLSETHNPSPTSELLHQKLRDKVKQSVSDKTPK